MWDCNKKELIARIKKLPAGSIIPMGQCGYILSNGNAIIALDTVISDLYYKGTNTSRRLIAPLFSVDEMPLLDAMLVTHFHADHFDCALIYSEAERNKDFKIIAPSSILSTLDIPLHMKVDIGDYGTCFLKGFDITAIPVPHTKYEESSLNHSLYYGYMINFCDMNIFHSGDTVQNERLLNAIRRYGKISYIFLPINGRDEKREKAGIVGNMDIEEAIEFACEAEADTLIPTHFDMFKENGADINEFIRFSEEKINYIIPVPGKPIKLKLT